MTTTSFYFLTGVEVRAPSARAIVTIGDSVTEGFASNGVDHVHPNDFGYRVMAEAIDLSEFRDNDEN